MDVVSFVTGILAPARDWPTYATYRAVSFIFIALMFVAALAAIVLVMLTPGNSNGILRSKAETLDICLLGHSCSTCDRVLYSADQWYLDECFLIRKHFSGRLWVALFVCQKRS